MEKRAMYSMGIMPMEEDNVKKKKRLGLGKLWYSTFMVDKKIKATLSSVMIESL